MANHDNSSARSYADSRISFVRQGATLLATILLSSAGICWIAANWANLSNLTRLAGTQALLAGLVVACVAAILRPAPGRQKNHNFRIEAHLIALAGVTVGALLALIGQIYQTGADAWQHFAMWAALLVPWLLVQPTILLCLLFALVGNTALALLLSQYHGPWWWEWSAGSSSALTVALLNAVLLILVERFASRLDDPWRITPRLIAATVAGWLVVAGLMAVDSLIGVMSVTVFAWLALAVLYWAYTRVRSDLAVVSMAVLAAFILLVWLLLYRVHSKIGLLSVVLVLVLAMFMGARKLRNLLHARSIHHEPWYVSVFRLVALGITALLLMVLSMLVLDLEAETLWIPSLLLCLLGVVAYRITSTAFVQEIGMTLAMSGLMLSAGSFFVLDQKGAEVAAYAVLMLAVGLYVPITNKVFRFITAVVSIGLFTLLSWPHDDWIQALFGRGFDPSSALPIYLRLWWFSVVAVAAFLGGRGAAANVWQPLAWSMGLLAQLIAWQVPPLQFASLTPSGFYAPSVWVIRLACAALPVVIFAAMLWRRPPLPRLFRVGASLGLAIAVLAWLGAPGVSLALLWVILGRLLQQRALLVFGVFALLIYLARFYYQLDTSLLHKSAVLGATGGWVLVVTWALTGMSQFAGVASRAPGSARAVQDGQSEGRLTPKWRGPYWQSAGLVLGLVLALAAANLNVYKHEKIVAHGVRVVLALAPVDPRSLMQGDYMRLDFEVARQVSNALQHMPESARRYVELQGAGLLMLRPDAAGVHRLAQVLPTNTTGVPDEVRHPGDVLLRFRMRRNSVSIGTNAWFFSEGQGARFQHAHYGEFRVNSKGVGVLVNLLDTKLNPLSDRN